MTFVPLGTLDGERHTLTILESEGPMSTENLAVELGCEVDEAQKILESLEDSCLIEKNEDGLWQLIEG